MSKLIETLKIHFAVTFPYFFLLLLGHSLRRSHGHLKFNHLCFITAGFIILGIVSIKKDFKFQLKTEFADKILSFIWAVFSVFLAIDHELIYAQMNFPQIFLKILLYFHACLALFHFAKTFFPERVKLPYKFNNIFLLSLVYLFAVSVLVIFASPHPKIDVFTILQEGTDFLLKGINPYTQSYSDTYLGQHPYVAGQIYWPGILLPLAATKFLFNDVRVFYIFCMGSTILALNALAHNFQLKNNTKFLLLLCWLSFPISFFILEQSWTEPILITQTAWLFYFLSKKKWVPSSIILGLLCATKQTVIFLVILCFLYIWKKSNFKNSAKLAAYSCWIALMLLLPFFLWDPQAFIGRTITDILDYSLRTDALSWPSYLGRFYGIPFSGKIYSILYLLAFGLITTWFVRVKNLEIKHLILAAIGIYGFIFLLGKYAFCNYYYFLSFLCFLFILSLLEKRPLLDRHD